MRFRVLDENINPENILENISQQEIYEYILGIKLIPNIFIHSIFREDKNPSVYFQWYNKMLWYIDWADTEKTHRNIFDVVQKYYNLPSKYDTLEFISDNFIHKDIKKDVIPKNKDKSQIQIIKKEYNILNTMYWEQYGITKEQLLQDKVYCFDKYFILKDNIRKEKISFSMAFAFCNFQGNRKKLYFPFNKKMKFLSSTNKDDIGETEYLQNDEKLIITKSYKDCRVLRNYQYQSIWIQSESTLPNKEVLLKTIENYKDIVIFYDNDTPGIEYGKKLTNFIKRLGKEARNAIIPNTKYKDISDFYKEKKEKETLLLLKNIL